MWVPVLLLAAAAAVQTVHVDQYPLRSGCGDTDSEVARLPAGTEVKIRFSLAGSSKPCFLVAVTLAGQPHEGWVFSEALSDPKAFEEARKAAKPVMVSATLKQEPVSGAVSKQAPRQFAVPASVHSDVNRAMELIQRNQPDEAQQIMERLLHAHPRNPGLLAVAGMAAYRNDRMADALFYWRESLDLKPDPALDQWYRDARREAAADRSKEVKVGMRFTLRYDGTVADSATASAMMEILEQEFARVSATLGCRADERITTIVQSRDAYFQGTRAAEWSAAAYDGKIRVPLLSRGPISQDMRNTFAHEIVHACLANIGSWPSWLHEGLAQKLTGRTVSAESWQMLKQLAKDRKLPTLNQLAQSWQSLGDRQARIAYELSLAAIELFYRHHSATGIRNLLHNPEMLPRIAMDLDRRLQGGE
ncbi:MAG: hypothetical protein ACKV22_14710 [Bryobacteraceae bacterium]